MLVRTRFARSCWLGSAALLAPAASFAAEAPPVALQSLLVDITVNGRAGEEAVTMLRDKEGVLYANSQTLRNWKLHLPDPATIEYEGDTFYELRPSSKLQVGFDEAAQAVTVEAAADLFEKQEALFASAEDMPMTPAGVGAFLNYDLVLSASRGNVGIHGAGELGFFTPRGMFTTNFIGRR